MQIKALDLFCSAGGATKGLQRAGFHVTGVDINPQPRYCGEVFVQADAMTFPLEGFDFIWASPPCQLYTVAGRNQRRDGKQYPDLVDPIRQRLIASGIPFVIENVPGAPLRIDLVLCGSHFDLPIVRHRLFEATFPVPPFRKCHHDPEALTICGHGTPSWMRQKRIRMGLHPNASVDMKREAMECPWMNRAELAQAIPPAYSEYIAQRFLASVSK